jgi:hypothetical protein
MFSVLGFVLWWVDLSVFTEKLASLHLQGKGTDNQPLLHMDNGIVKNSCGLVHEREKYFSTFAINISNRSADSYFTLKMEAASNNITFESVDVLS